MLTCALQATGGEGGTDKALLAGAIVLLVAVPAFFILLWLRRRCWPRPAGREAAEGLCIDDLERMRRSGQISEEEFRRLRRPALDLDVSAGGEDNSSLSRPAANDDGQDSAGRDEPREEETER